MIEYKCNRCNKIFNKKSNYQSHINRKYPCKQQDINDDANGHKKTTDNIINTNDCIKNIQLPPHDDKNPVSPKIIKIRVHTCNFCKKIFTRSDSLNKHLKGRCKVRKQEDNQKEEILQRLLREFEEMKKENKELRNEVNKMKIENRSLLNTNTTNITNNTANIKQLNQLNNINVKIVAFRKEDLSYIKDDMYAKIINKGFKSVPALVEYVHFNKNKPENHNVYISNMQNNYVLVYDGEDWKLKEKDEILQQLMDDKAEKLAEKFDELINKLDDCSIRKFQRFLDQKDEDKVINTIKNDLKLMLYNNKKIPEKTRELLNINYDKVIEK